MLLRPFVPVLPRADQRTELQAYMTASSDPDTYGQLTAYVVAAPLPDGPRTVSNQIDSEPSIAQQITLQTGGGNRVRFGDLQLIPVADGLLYVRPFYAAVPQSSDRATTVTGYRFVIVAYDGRAAYGESLGEALAKLFPGFEGDLGDRVGVEDEPEHRRRGRRPARPPGTTDGTPAELLAQAGQLLDDADLRARGARPRRLPGQHRGGRGARRPGAGPAQGAGGRVEEPGGAGADDVRRPDWAGRADAAGSLGSERSRRRTRSVGTGASAGALELAGQPGQILAERHLVAGLLVGQADLAVADLDERGRVDRRPPRGRRARRCRGRAR